VAEKHILTHPILSEKMVRLQDEMNQYGFVVAREVNKIEIKKAIEERYQVQVDSVRTVNMRGKVKRMGRHSGRRSAWKKALVTLKAGDKIELVEGL
jgi:large subunit ribosomal protein L23